MFDIFREKLQTVQGNFTASLRGLNETQPPIGQKLHQHELNYGVGTELLERFQSNWVELNTQGVYNAKQAEVVDERIGMLHKDLDKKWRNVSQCCALINKLPEVITEVEAITEKIDVLGELFVTVEKSLLHLKDLIETRELQERQLDHRFQLALYKEKKLSQLENTRVELAREHAEKVAIHEARQSRVKKERQEAFEQQFRQDLTLYKQTKNIPKIEQRSPEAKELKLEEVELDMDDGEALNEFLEESQPEQEAYESSENPINEAS